MVRPLVGFNTSRPLSPLGLAHFQSALDWERLLRMIWWPLFPDPLTAFDYALFVAVAHAAVINISLRR